MRRVVKIGGSLLERDDLPRALTNWLAVQSVAETLMVVGGGGLVDAIRRLDRGHAGDDVETHWLCVELLDVTFRIASTWFDQWHRIGSAEELTGAIDRGFSSDAPTLVAVGSFYRQGDDARIPTDWRTTADTIAAVLATLVDADELVLLKSCDVSAVATIDEMVTAGIIDEALPMIAGKLKRLRVEKLI